MNSAKLLKAANSFALESREWQDSTGRIRSRLTVAESYSVYKVKLNALMVDSVEVWLVEPFSLQTGTNVARDESNVLTKRYLSGVAEVVVRPKEGRPRDIEVMSSQLPHLNKLTGAGLDRTQNNRHTTSPQTSLNETRLSVPSSRPRQKTRICRPSCT